MADYPTEQVDRVAQAVRDRIAQHGYAMSLDTARDLACAALDAATHARDPIVAAVQDAVVNAINALGVILVGPDFELFTSSPIPDEEVAEMVQSAVGSVGEREPVSTEFDRLPLPMQMRVAASVIDKVNRRAGDIKSMPPLDHEWCSSSLHRWAEAWEVEDVKRGAGSVGERDQP